MEGRKILFLIGCVFIVIYVMMLTVGTPKATTTNKSIDDLEDFLALDQTDKHEYTSTYNCFNFSRDLKTNAEAKGFDAHLVYIGSGPTDHCIVLFELQNENVFVEPQNDSIINNVFDEYKSETFVTIWI